MAEPTTPSTRKACATAATAPSPGSRTSRTATRGGPKLKQVCTGYGVAYERDDVQFIDSSKIALDLENLRYMVNREMPFPSQQAAFDEICAHKDVLSLRRSIAPLWLAKPI